MSQTYKPADGRAVPLEDGQPWPTNDKGEPEAMPIADTLYWRRRLADKDIEEVATTTPARSKPAAD